ncbi:MAG: PAS domain-containing sensor histidine kinase [Methanothrix sp.]|nr:MAG: PAS domain-containing sensor histidine kinase [Methanothrix sp.]
MKKTLQTITGQKHKKQKLEHVNRVLSSIRDFNQLITNEWDCDKLLKYACDSLVNNSGYHSAWIATLDESSNLLKFAETGWGKEFLPVVERLNRGELPHCVKKALRQTDVVITKHPSSICPDCHLSDKCDERWAMTIQLQHGSRSYGIACVSIPVDFLANADEFELFRTVTHKIAFNLHDIELQKKQKLNEDELRKTNDYLEGLFNYANAPIVVLDQQSRIIRFNRAFENLTGNSVNEIVGIPFGVFVPENRQDVINAHIREAMAGKRWDGVEIDIKQADGRVSTVLWNSATLYNADGTTVTTVIIQGQDITRRKLAIKMLQKSERRYRSLFENSLDGIYTSTTEGRFIDANPALVKMLGYESKEDLFSISIPKDVYVSASDRPDATQRNRIFRTRFKKNDGTQISVEINSWVFFNEKDEPLYYENIIRDITDREKLEERLRQAEKMEAIGLLSGGIAHDFNNILAVIIWGTELAMYQIPEESKARRHLKQVLDASERAKNLVNQILTFSRQKNYQLKPVQIGPIIKEALSFLRASLPATIEIRSNIITVSDTVMADNMQIYRVLVNLCTNAAHAMQDNNGVLEIILEDVDIDAGIMPQYQDLNTGPVLRLTVSDTGHGMSPEIRKRIFDPFFTTKGPSVGTGMGLAVVYGIVKSCGGAIKVESEPGKGSVFQIFFPRFDGAAAPEIEVFEPIHGGGEQILFVDDEQVLAKLGQNILQNLGYKVVAKTSSVEALETFRIQPDRFDLVITDQTMPHMTGETLASELMRIRKDIPIIICTGYSNVISQERAMSMGIRELVGKPIDMRHIAQTIRRILDQQEGQKIRRLEG